MENFLFNLLLAFLVSISLLWFYWAAFYPAIILKARFRMTAIQDEVRLSVLDDEKLAMTRAYLEFEHFLQISRRVVQHHDIVGLYVRHPHQHELEEIEQRINAIFSEPELAEKFKELTRWMLAVRIVAAPTFLCIAAFLAFFSLFSDWARNLARMKEKEAFTIGEGLPA